MAGIKIAKRKVTVTKEVRTIEVGSNYEAAVILRDYCEIPSRDFFAKYGITVDGRGGQDFEEARALAYAAAAHVIREVGPIVKPETLASLGVDPIGERPIEPTWTSSDGKTIPLRKMPTPYLQSVRRFAASMGERDERNKPRGQGLVDAIDAELERREDGDDA